ncbi:MAG: F0F1 ATP synthase subunit A [Endomicrobium sp.]|jgi:F-type H+-transporting ATPase subunit a|nr:F0F1 ATP synthase subunit A [Endomicrobium sp.]
MSISPDILFTIAGFPVTNTVISTVITDIVLIALVLSIRKFMSVNPGKIQNAFEAVSEYFYDMTSGNAGSRASYIHPWVLSIFLFIVVSNLTALFPGFETVRFLNASDGHHGVPLLRGATSDLNLTLALAVISVVMTHYFSVKYTGIKAYIGRFLSFTMFPIMLFVGILEFMNEITKLISFSFRLFGNIYSGEVVISTMYSMFPIGLPVPFIMLEVLIAVIQAMVFAILTMSFMSMFTDKAH